MFELRCAATGSELSQPASSGEDDETDPQTGRQTERQTDALPTDRRTAWDLEEETHVLLAGRHSSVRGGKSVIRDAHT